MQLKLEWRDGRLRPVPLAREPRPRPNSYVETLQASLNAAGCPCVVDGRFGRETEKAVKRFQKRHVLEETGRVDPETARVLGAATAALVVGGEAAGTLTDDDTLREWVDEEGADVQAEQGEERDEKKGKKGKKKKKGKRKKQAKGEKG